MGVFPEASFEVLIVRSKVSWLSLLKGEWISSAKYGWLTAAIGFATVEISLSFDVMKRQ